MSQKNKEDSSKLLPGRDNKKGAKPFSQDTRPGPKPYPEWLMPDGRFTGGYAG